MVWRRTLDTCECKYYYNSTTQNPHELISFDKKCNAHQTISNDQTLFNILFEENGRKNESWQMILDNAPSTIYEFDVEGTKIFKTGIVVSWSFTGTPPNRVLTLTITGISLTGAQKNSIQTKLDQRFGISNIIIVN